ALASRVLASSGLMSYLSKSKKTSRRAAIDVNSFGAGRAAGAAGAGAVGVGAGALGAADAAGAGVDGVPSGGAAGAGADVAAVVAGRFAQPISINPSSNDKIGRAHV